MTVLVFWYFHVFLASSRVFSARGWAREILGGEDSAYAFTEQERRGLCLQVKLRPKVQALVQEFWEGITLAIFGKVE